VSDLAVAQPFRQPGVEVIVREVLAPYRREFLAGFCERPIQIEQAHQSRPLPRPVCDRQNRPLVAAQAGQHVMTVLPRRRGENDPGFGMDLHEHIHSHALRRDEAMLFLLVVGVSANKFEALLRKGRGQFLFHVSLRGPTLLVGRKPQIAAGNEQHFICRRLCHFTFPHCHLVLLLAADTPSAAVKYTPLDCGPAKGQMESIGYRNRLNRRSGRMREVPVE
jgi:hypothetical protein